MRLRPLLTLPLSAVLAAGLVAGCGSASGGAGDSAASGGGSYPVELERCGRTITVEEKPESIVSLNQGTTEILLSLGVSDRMSGAAGWTDPILDSLADDNEGVKSLANQEPSYETLLDAEPDLVTASFFNTLSEGGVATPEQLDKVDVPSYLSSVECEKSDFAGGDGARDEPLEMESIHTEVRDLATLVDEEDAGEEVIDSLDERMDEASTSQAKKGTSVVYWFANSESPYVAGGYGGPEIASRSLGLDNVFADEKDEWPQISWEAIAAEDPDVLVLGDLTRKSQTAETAKAKINFLESNAVTKEMTAVKNEQYISVTGAELNPSIRTVDLVENMSAGLEDLDLADQ